MIRRSTSKQISYGAIFLFAFIMLIGITLMLMTMPQEKPSLQPEQAASDSLQVQPKSAIDWSGTLYKVFWVTGVIIVFILVAGRWYKKNVLGQKQGESSEIKISARQPLGQGQYLLIVYVGKKKLLLGITEHQINLVSELGEATQDELQKVSGESSIQFASVLRRLRKSEQAAQ